MVLGSETLNDVNGNAPVKRLSDQKYKLQYYYIINILCLQFDIIRVQDISNIAYLYWMKYNYVSKLIYV